MPDEPEPTDARRLDWLEEVAADVEFLADFGASARWCVRADSNDVGPPRVKAHGHNLRAAIDEGMRQDRERAGQ